MVARQVPVSCVVVLLVAVHLTVVVAATTAQRPHPTIVGTSTTNLTLTDSTDPRVFNVYFYLTTNADLPKTWGPQEAQQHWLSHGIAEGRQACGAFHMLQYLSR
jgi:hypothetical protein